MTGVVKSFLSGENDHGNQQTGHLGPRSSQTWKVVLLVLKQEP